MKLVSYIEPGVDGKKASYGALEGDRLVDLSTHTAPTLRSALATEGVDGLRQRFEARRKDAGVPATSVQLVPPIPDPEKILCIGLNYFLHAQEVNMPVPSNPSVFVRYPNSFVGQGQPVLRPMTTASSAS
jgi:2-keto-4-pentenoate hydratase/2-oxohepta-3-ene-1,7-dioic acid hydratase in catechol pathway